jgi:hypothetical protein
MPVVSTCWIDRDPSVPSPAVLLAAMPPLSKAAPFLPPILCSGRRMSRPNSAPGGDVSDEADFDNGGDLSVARADCRGVLQRVLACISAHDAFGMGVCFV